MRVSAPPPGPPKETCKIGFFLEPDLLKILPAPGCVYVRSYVRMHACMYVCMHVRTYVCTYVCMYVLNCVLSPLSWWEPHRPCVLTCVHVASMIVCWRRVPVLTWRHTGSRKPSLHAWNLQVRREYTFVRVSVFEFVCVHICVCMYIHRVMINISMSHNSYDKYLWW